MTTPYNIDETFRRYHELLATEPDFFLKPDCNICVLSDKLGVNRSLTSRFINLNLKTTFNQLVRAAQLRKMEQLVVANPRRDIKEIIQEAGFTCDISFRRAYMEKYGELPTRFCTNIISDKKKSKKQLKKKNP